MDGFLNVLLTDVTSVTDTQTALVFVNDTTGEIATHATAIAGHTQATNMKFESTGAAGDIVVLSIARVA